MHVGEIALLEPFKGRSASVAAIDTVMAALITQQRFTEIARFHPELWRRLAIELARRLVAAQGGG
jgi:CRP-like cAMP-binding protein